MVLFASVHIGILKERNIHACAELDEPVVGTTAVIVVFTRHFFDHGEAFFLDHDFGLLGRRVNTGNSHSCDCCKDLLSHIKQKRGV